MFHSTPEPMEEMFRSLYDIEDLISDHHYGKSRV